MLDNKLILDGKIRDHLLVLRILQQFNLNDPSDEFNVKYINPLLQQIVRIFYYQFIAKESTAKNMFTNE